MASAPTIRVTLDWTKSTESGLKYGCRIPSTDVLRDAELARCLPTFLAVVCDTDAKRVMTGVGARKIISLAPLFVHADCEKRLVLYKMLSLPTGGVLFILKDNTPSTEPRETIAGPLLYPPHELTINGHIQGAAEYQELRGWWVLKLAACKRDRKFCGVGARVLLSGRSVGLVVGRSENHFYCLSWGQILARCRSIRGGLCAAAPRVRVPELPAGAELVWESLASQMRWLPSAPPVTVWTPALLGVLMQCLLAGAELVFRHGGAQTRCTVAWEPAEEDKGLQGSWSYEVNDHGSEDTSCSVMLLQVTAETDNDRLVEGLSFFKQPFAANNCCVSFCKPTGAHHSSCPRPQPNEMVFSCGRKDLCLQQGVNYGRLIRIESLDQQQTLTWQLGLAQLRQGRTVRFIVGSVQDRRNNTISILELRPAPKNKAAAGLCDKHQ